MDQLDIAVHQTAHDAPGGLNTLARSIGVGEQVLRNKVCPTTDTHKLNLREAVAIMDATNDDRILEVLADWRGYTLARKALPDAKSIVSAVLADAAKHGDVANEIEQALADGKLTEIEKASISRRISEAHTSLDVLNSTLQRAPLHLAKA